MIARLLVVGLLLGHGLIHAAYLAPHPPVTAGGPAWPFQLGHSWLLGSLGMPAETNRVIGLGLVTLTIAGFGLAAVAALGIAPAALWAPAIAVGAAASLGLLVVFFHPWLALGVAIDIALLWVALIIGWTPGQLPR
ncbi:MAG TPA: hypothetical protein VE011_04295 [Candidatus Dormibacteraeota bacterium]|nr:hypothetical protein [Candidatus Dormibacteraeota bacterium]